MPFYIDLFEEAVEKFSDRVAVRTATETITYQELNERANKLAYDLKAKGVAPGDCVGILKNHSIDLVIAKLACWKINAAFMLLDPKHEANEQTLDRCKINTVIKDPLGPNARSSDNPQRDPLDETLAYYISTSGTTAGVGKIVAINHTAEEDSGIVGAMQSTADELDVTEDDVVLCSTKVSFDPLIANMHALLRGASLYMPDQDEFENPASMFAHCSDHNANIMVITPSQIAALEAHRASLVKIKGLRFLVLGEEVTLDHIKKLKSFGSHDNPVDVVTAYGNTEGPIGQTATKHRDGDCVSIGKAMKGREYKIVKLIGKTAVPVKPGERGVMIWKSKGFAGYLDNELATDAMRVSLLEDGKQKAGWMSTGDEVSYVTHQGEIKCDDAGVPLLQYHGRLDMDMIKGPAATRLEVLTFAENIRDHTAVKEARSFVVPKSKRLNEIVTFVKLTQEQSDITAHELDRYLRDVKKQLRVLVHKVVILDKDDDFSNYPSKTDKLDHKKLAERYKDQIHPENEYKTLEERLLVYWAEILGYKKEALTKQTNFRDAGGDSYREHWLIALLYDDALFELGFVNIEVDIMPAFKRAPTIENLATLIRHNQGRDKLITYYHKERKGLPVMVVGDVSQLQLDQLSAATTQPIIHIAKRDGDGIQELIKTLRLANDMGPYFILGADQSEVGEVSQLLKTHYGSEVVFKGGFDEESSLNLAKAHDAYFKAQLDAKLAEIEHTIIVDLKDYKRLSLDQALRCDGFSKELIELLADEEINVIYRNIESFRRINDFLKDPTLNKLNKKTCSFNVQAGLGDSFDSFDNPEYSTITVEGYMPEDFKYDDSDIGKAVGNWYKNHIELTHPLMSSMKKSELFAQFMLYAKQMADYMGGDSQCEIMGVGSLVQDEHALDRPGSKLFDAESLHTKQCFNAAPFEIFIEGEKRKIRFLHLELAAYFRDLDDYVNPYQQDAVDEQAAQKKLFERLTITHNPEAGCKPLFMFAPLTGEHTYATIAEKLGVNQPVISFQHPFRVLGEQNQFKTIEALAAYYVNCMVAVYPEGPYSLGGWSFGGFVANEVAHQLMAKGFEVDYLGIIDTPSPALIKGLKRYDAKIFKWICGIHEIKGAEEFIRQCNDQPITDVKQMDAMWEALISIAAYDQEACEAVTAYWSAYQSAYGYESVGDIANRYVYQASVNHDFYDNIPAHALAWPVDEAYYHKIKGASHFTITKDEYGVQLAASMRADLAESRKSSDAQHLKSIIIQHVVMLVDQHDKLKPKKPLELYDMQDIANDDASRIILGHSGAGKSTLMRRIFRDYAERYLDLSSQSPVPLFFSFKNFKDLKSYIASLGLAPSQLEALLKRDLVLFMDGLDEVPFEAVRDSLKYLRGLGATQVKLIAACKQHYYDQVSELSTTLGWAVKGAEPFKLPPLNSDQQQRMLEGVLEHATEQEKQWLLQFLGTHPLDAVTPMYLERLAYTGIELAKGYEFELRNYTRAELQEQQLINSARKSRYEFKMIKRFCQALAVRYYKRDEWFERLLSEERDDVNFLVECLGLQKTATGYAFSHHSEQEYHFACVLFDELINGVSDGILSKVNLCYEYDVLKYIGDLLYEEIEKSDSGKEWCKEFGELIKPLLERSSLNVWQCRTSSSSLNERPEWQCMHRAAIEGVEPYKTLSANIISIVAACNYPYLELSGLTGMVVGELNLSNANLERIRVGYEHIDGIVMQGAYHKGSEYRHRSTYSMYLPISTEPLLESSSHLYRRIDNTLDYEYKLRRSCIVQPPLSWVQARKYKFEDSRHVMTVPHRSQDIDAQLEYHTDLSEIGVGRGFYILRINLHITRSLLFTHGYRNFLWSFYRPKIDVARLAGSDEEEAHYTRCAVGGAQVMRSGFGYVFPESDQYSIGFIEFHPDHPIIFAFSKPVEGVASTMIVVSPFVNYPIFISDVNSSLGSFIINIQNRFLIHESKTEICLRNISAPYNIVGVFNLQHIYPNSNIEITSLSLGNSIKSDNILIGLMVDGDYHIIVYDVNLMKSIFSVHVSCPIEICALSDDNKILAFLENNSIITYDLVKFQKKIVHYFTEEQDANFKDSQMAFEDDILLFCHNATLIKYRFNLRLIDQSITNRPLHNGAVNQIAVTTLKKKIATTSGTELAVWHALTLFRLLYLNFDEEVGPILFTGDGSYLLVTLNNIIQLLDTTTGNKLRSVVVPVDSGMRVNDLVNYPYRHSIIIVRAREAAVEKTYLYDWKSDVLNVENFEREQRNLVVRIGRKLLQELDLIDRPMPDYALLYRDLKLRYQANLILFSPYRRFIFIYSQSLNLLLFLNFDGSERYRFNYESDGPNLNATFSRTGQFLAIIAEDGTTYVWSVMLKAVLFDLSFETHFATSVYWDAEDHFYVGAQDGAVYMYDLSEFNYFYHKLNSACCKPSLLVSEDLSRRTRASNNQASLYGTLTKHRHEEKLSPYEGSMEAYNPW